MFISPSEQIYFFMGIKEELDMFRKALVIIAFAGAIGMMSALTTGCGQDEPAEQPQTPEAPQEQSQEQPAPTPGTDIDDFLD